MPSYRPLPLSNSAFLPPSVHPLHPFRPSLPAKSQPSRPYPRVVRKRLRLPCRVVAVTDLDAPTVHEKASFASLDTLVEDPHRRRFIFFGGKGGVGKTSSAAAVGVQCADEGLKTLVISTDPAHSLGDALKVDLSDGKIRKVDPDLELYAVESDTKEAVEEFRGLLASLNAADTVKEGGESGGTGRGGWGGMASKLGLQEFSEVLETIPPGADELIALVSVLELVQQEKPDVHFDRVIIDTAPTGHTLRFLAFPDFLDKFLTQALALREKLDNARGLLGNVTKMFMGGGRKKVNVNDALQKAANRVRMYRDKMIELSELFRDPERTEFVVVTIPTILAVEESKRLIEKLWDEGIWVRHVIVNQVLPESDDGTVTKYLSQVRRGQAKEISFATEQIADEYGLFVSLVPRFDTEVRGVYALEALANIAFKENRRKFYGLLFDQEARAPDGSKSQFMFVGGKGGVGKTSVAAALGVKLAGEGLKTLVLSTDPAHSLADSLQTSLKGGAPVPVDFPSGDLYAMEIDTEGAIAEFQTLAKDFVREGNKGVGVDLARKLGLEEFAGLLDNAPPGIDELVALTQVMELVKFGDFDRVIVDTAPTGHTLRLLSFPDFLDKFLGKVMRLKRRLDSAIDTLRNVLGRKDSADAVDRAAQGVDRLRENMAALRDLVADGDRTQFAIVTVPTGLAMAESERLVRSLRKDGVKVRNLIINQVVPDASALKYVKRIIEGQDHCIEDLRRAGEDKNITLTRVPFFDVEVRGVYGLRAMAGSMFSTHR